MGNKHRPIPLFNQAIIETHCHLDHFDKQELETVLEESAKVGIEKMLTIAVSRDNLDKVASLVEQYDNIWGTQGIHPHDAEQYDENTKALIQQNCQHEKILAVGEIGLDYYYDHADRATQRRVFEQQLQLSIDLQLPVVIHTREAEEDTRDILANFTQLQRAGGVLHSFTSSLALAEFCLSQGFYLGFNGIVTFNKADNVREVVAATPVDRILLETDTPYLTPAPYRGRKNAPFYLPFIAEKIAEVKDMDIQDLLTSAYHNADQLFFQAHKG